MDWSLIILIAVIALFAWRGFRSGFIRSLGRVFAILAGYTAAILFSTQLSAWIEMQFGIQICFPEFRRKNALMSK